MDYFVVFNIYFHSGTFTESYDECTSQSNTDGNYPSSSSISSINNSNLLPSVLINSQIQLNNQSTSLPCTVSKRPQKLNNNDDLLSTNSLVQTTTRNNKISNGNNDDESLSTYKQQKKQLVKSSNTQNTQSRRQQKKQETREQTRAASRDSSSSYNNGFATNQSIENSDIEKK